MQPRGQCFGQIRIDENDEAWTPAHGADGSLQRAQRVRFVGAAYFLAHDQLGAIVLPEKGTIEIFGLLAEGKYGEARILPRGEVAVSQALPELRIDVAELLAS